MSWCLLQVLAETIHGKQVSRTALDLFDRLRLREPLAHSYNAMGLEGDEGWRAAARLKILLLVDSVSRKSEAAAKDTEAAAGVVAEAPSQSEGMSAIPADLWHDPDVRWLTGYNEAEGHAYVNREQYEELLWWLALPELLRIAGMTGPMRVAAAALSRSVGEAMAAIEKAGYRVDLLVKAAEPAPANQPDATAMETTAVGSKPGVNAPMPSPEELEPQEPVNVRPAGPDTDPDGPPEDY